MENLQNKPSLGQKRNELNQENFTKMDLWLLDNSNATKNLPEKDSCNIQKSFEILKDCIKEPDNVNKSTSVLDIKNKNNVNKRKDCSLQESKVLKDSSMEVDLSDLTFSCNDFILGDCTCFEQASQLVDPSLKDSESTPFSFNNSDSVQLFRYNLTESTDDSLIGLAKDNLFHNNTEKCDKMVCSADTSVKNDHYNFYHVFELFDNNMNVNKEKKSFKEENVQKVIKKKKDLKNALAAPIKKGRRYLPNFKQKVLEYAKNHTFKETASHFKINCNTITEWSRESKRLSQQQKCTTPMPGSDFNNYKTDIVDTYESKTDIILLNDDISLETAFNEPLLKNIEEDLPTTDMKPDEKFLKWVEKKRLERKQLSRQEVYYIAKCCLRKAAPNHEKPTWFVSWFKRFTKVLKNSIKTNTEAEKYIKYPNNFKLEVVLYARVFTKNSAARVFNVPRRRMFDWFNRLCPLKDSSTMNTNKGINGHSKEVVQKDKVFCETKKDKTKNKIYSELHLWYQKKFKSGARPSSYEIKEKAREFFSSCGITGIKFSDGWLQKFCQRMNIKLRHSDDDRLLLWVLSQFDNNKSLSHQDITEKSTSLIRGKKFKGSKDWTLRFLKRHCNLLQYFPSAHDQWPHVVQEKLNCFLDNFQQSLISLNVPFDNIGCMDEIPLTFNYPEEGKKSLPLLRKTGFENCQGIMILSALASGRLLPPAVVFKGKGSKELLLDESVNIFIFYQEKGLVTDEVMESWMNDVWLSSTSTPSALVLDSYEPHCAVSLRQLTEKESCSLHVIPEGCSSKFQPLDVEVTPVFKEAIKKQWKEFSANNVSTHKLTSNYRCPDRDTILHWVRNAYDKLKRNPLSITNSFKTTRLLQ